MKFSQALLDAIFAQEKLRNFQRAQVSHVAIKKAMLERDVIFAALDAFFENKPNTFSRTAAEIDGGDNFGG